MAQYQKLRVHSQHLLVTDIDLAYDDGRTDRSIFWDHFIPSSSLPQTRYSIQTSEFSPEFIRHVKLNDNTSGITVSYGTGDTRSIHSHSGLSSQSAEFYKGIESETLGSLIWIYFPLAPKKVIAAG
ncbi:hypothetical protein AOQ84DRAFT_378473 [Glonium stellatum]|uniref:Uncharacterized protein n=1 Tax=Glonium stellatum TaxID=574774 RepID=A0A8E2EX75_9PEZI|nr:hypothetical protein AOQ84DRAFT_378473 [Glonium stellatum]